MKLDHKRYLPLSLALVGLQEDDAEEDEEDDDDEDELDESDRDEESDDEGDDEEEDEGEVWQVGAVAIKPAVA